MKTQTKTYESGLRLVVATRESRAVSVLIGVNTGCANESESNNGISHLIEHMVFKGSQNRTKEQISEEFESIGAITNADTGVDHTFFYAQCTDENLDKTTQILADIVLNPKMDKDELEREKKVVYEEIDMCEDDPADVAYESFMEAFFKGYPHARRILGTREILEKLTNKDIFDYMGRFYTADNMVVSFAGGITIAEAEKLMQKYFGKLINSPKRAPRKININQNAIIKPESRFNSIKKDIQMCYIVFGFAIANIHNDLKPVLKLISIIFGGGISSRLFKIIRDKYGYVYDIHSQPTFFDIGGTLTVHLGTNEKYKQHALESIKQIMEELIREGATPEELKKAKTLSKSVLIITGETNQSIARANASSMLDLGKLELQEEKIKRIDDVTLQQVNSTIKKYFKTKNICGAIVSSKPDIDVFKPLNV